MKNRRRKRLHNYIMFLLAVCILSGFLLDHVIDFFVGFLAGWNQIRNKEEARMIFGDLGQKTGWAFTGAILLVISVCCYRKMRKKITGPIERLANNMNEVREGNLTVRTSIDGDFEIIDIQEAFNSMVQELESAKKIRETTEQKNQQLYAGIAHDLKTPMTMVLGYAKLLEQDHIVSAEDKKRYIRTIIEQTEHTNVLLDSLLAYTKLENQSYQLKKEKRDIVECLRECVANYYPMLEKAEIQMELILPDKKILCVFDHVEMKRVFTNLLANIVKHTPQKTTCIILLKEVTDKDMDPSSNHNNHNNHNDHNDKDPNSNHSDHNDQDPGKKKIQIIIADDGPKIPKDLQTTIFDSFVVGERSRNTKNGSGLGLSISKRIIERHNGSLYYIDDWRGRFKCFQIDLNMDLFL